MTKVAFSCGSSGSGVGVGLPGGRVGGGSGNVLQGGGLFYSPTLSTDFYELPRSLREERMWYKWFYDHHPVIGRGIDMHTNLPLSKALLTLPESKDPDKARKILNFFERMWKEIRGDQHLAEVAHHYWMYGEAFPFLEYDEERAKWVNARVLDGALIEVSRDPFSGEGTLYMIPDQDELEAFREATEYHDTDDRLLDLIEKLEEFDGKIPLDADPMSGTHIAHIMRQVGSDGVRGVSILKRCLMTLLFQDKLRQAQTQISSRNMTPKHLIWAEGINADQLEDLRAQVDMAFSEPDFSILANYQVHWETIGANDRLLDLQSENEYSTMELLTGLGLTREIVSGEGNWGSTRINLEVMNTEYLLFREDLQHYVEEHIFRPIAIANDFVEEDEYGELIVLYPKLAFSRLSIRDNEAVFGDLFSLFSKGSLPATILFELYNLDPEEVRERLKEETFTILDPQFNEAIRGAYGPIGEALGAEPDIRMKVAESLDINPSPLFLNGQSNQEGGAGGFGGPPGGDFGGDLGGDLGDGAGEFDDLGMDFGDGGDVPEGDLGGEPGDGIPPPGGGEAPPTEEPGGGDLGV